MISGPGYMCWIEQRRDGWHVFESAPGFTDSYGPFRWQWIAKLVKWLIEK